jgi:hypothetical protein
VALLLGGLFFCGDLLRAGPAVPGGKLPAGAVTAPTTFDVTTAGVRVIYAPSPATDDPGFGPPCQIEGPDGALVGTAQPAVAVKVKDGTSSWYWVASFPVKPGRYTVDSCVSDGTHLVGTPPHLLGLSDGAVPHLVGQWLLVLGLLPGLVLGGLLWRRTRAARSAARALAAG